RDPAAPERKEQREHGNDQHKGQERPQMREREEPGDDPRADEDAERLASDPLVKERERQEPERKAVQARALRTDQREGDVLQPVVRRLKDGRARGVVEKRREASRLAERLCQGEPPTEPSSEEEQSGGERGRVGAPGEAPREREDPEQDEHREHKAL